MSRKPLALTALTLGAALALSGCAAQSQSTFDYLQGSWDCTGTEPTATGGGVAPFTMHVKDEAFSFETESEFLTQFFDWMTPLSITEEEGLVTGPDFTVQLPATKPDDEGLVAMPMTAPSGEAGTAELRATVDGSSFNVTMNEVSNGSVLWDAGTCTRQ
jgi:hypothetical protein